MGLLKFVFLLAPAVAITACDNPVSPGGLVGTWVTPAESLSPRGSFTRELTFSRSGQYVAAFRSRGVYGLVRPDSVDSYTLSYGSYTLDGNTLRQVQDSVVGWDLVSGRYKQTGLWFYIEGPPTDPVISLTLNSLVLRFRVNPGNGYVEVQQVYYRR